MSVLQVRDLSVRFGQHRRYAVEGVSFSLADGDRLGIIGASGSGKSVTCLAIMGLLPETAEVRGSITFDGQELIGLPEREYRTLRGDQISMVFQEPMTSLDPTMRVGRQIGGVVALHHREERGAINSIVEQWLHRCGIEQPRRVAEAYPHELSGGQRQRALIAMALANRPEIVLCDEPTTALDVIVQRQVLDLLDTELEGRSCLFVSHDLAVVNRVCDDVVVMHEGQIVESGKLSHIVADPQHQHTRNLIDASQLGTP